MIEILWTNCEEKILSYFEFFAECFGEFDTIGFHSDDGIEIVLDRGGDYLVLDNFHAFDDYVFEEALIIFQHQELDKIKILIWRVIDAAARHLYLRFCNLLVVLLDETINHQLEAQPPHVDNLHVILVLQDFR